ncbi:MAG: Uncharacterised protein [Hyphomonas sp. TMED17]|nr:MAG: Uncharacterised protein [Hyphomonas sp. TMED17]
MRAVLTEPRHRWKKSVVPVLGAAALLATVSAQAADPIDINPETYCQWPEGQRVSLLASAVRSGWSDLDVNGSAFIGRVNPHDANFGDTPLPERHPMRQQMERYLLQLQQIMVRIGVLFPHYNRPMDGERLIERFMTRSVPIYASAAEHQIVVMETFLSADDKNREIGIAFIEALHALESSTLALVSGDAAPALNEQNQALYDAFHDFMSALKASLFSPDFEKAIGRRLTPYCADLMAEL